MRRPKIFVCDDDAMIVQIVVSKLLSEGYDVGSAASGRDLLQKLRGEVPDLVIVDAMMPGIDGGTVVETIRATERLKTLPMMMLSAKRDPDFVNRMVRAGITDYLAKPFSLGELADRVRKIVSSDLSSIAMLD